MINAIIFLNDDSDHFEGSCSSSQHGFDNNHGHTTNQNLFFLLSVSAPKPLFPVAGYPLIYHHVRALAEISQVRNVFLVGKYAPTSFNYFIDSLYDEFCFNTVQYISDDSPNNEAGLLFKHKTQFLVDDPEYFFCLRYKICSTFPLQKIISFHKDKEVVAQREFEETQKLLEIGGQPDSETKLKNLKLVTPLITVMGVQRKTMYGTVQGPTIVSESSSKQILHYADAHERASDKDVVNAGIYYISTEIYREFDEEHPIIIFEEDKAEQEGGEGAMTPFDHQNNNNEFDIEMTNLEEDYFNIESPEKKFRHGQGRQRFDSTVSAANHFSSTRKSTISGISSSHLCNQQEDLRFKRFEQDFRYVNATQLQISIKDILLPILGQKKAFVYKLDFNEDFYLTIERHEDKLLAQLQYFDYYSRISPHLVKQAELLPEQIVGATSVSIHPTAEVHHTAILGPNVSVGAKAKIRAGCRIQNSIILEDAEIQQNSYISCSLVGWNSKIGPWCRLEGSMVRRFTEQQSNTQDQNTNQGQKFDVTVLGHGVTVYPEVMLRDCLVMPMNKITSNKSFMIIF